MFDAVVSIVKFLEQELQSKYNYRGRTCIEEGNRYDVQAGLPAVCVNDNLWDWDPFQYGSEADQICNIYVEVLAGSKAEALRIATWIGGYQKPGPNSSKGVLLRREVPLLDFMLWNEGDPDPAQIGVIEFTRHQTSSIVGFQFDTAENTYMYQMRWNAVKVRLNTG